MKNRVLSIFLSTAMLLCGCGASSDALPVSQNTSDSSLSRAPVTISFSWWGNDNRHEYTMNGVDIFQEENPEIAVANRYSVWAGYEKRMNVAIESHTETDVMQINYAWLSNYSPDGNGFYDLYKLSDELGLENYTESDLQYGIVNGKLNAIPIAFNTYEVFCNRDIWARYGLDNPSCIDDLFTAADVMRNDDIYPLGTVKKTVFVLMCSYFEQTHGRSVFDDDGKLNINEEDACELLSLYRRMIDEKVLCPIDDFERSKFASGQIAATMCWVSDAGNYCGALADNGGTPEIGGFLINDDAKLSGWYIKPATMYAISAYTEHPHESAKLLNFLVNSPKMAELQLSEKGIPVSKSALNTVNGIPDAVSAYEYSASRYMTDHQDRLTIIKPIMENEVIIDAFKDYGDEYIYDQLSLEEAAAEMLAAMKKCTDQR